MSKRVYILIVQLVLFVSGYVYSNESLHAKERWEIDDVKKFLKLPYAEKFDELNKDVDLTKFERINGLSEYAIIPGTVKFVKPKIVQFLVCSSDITFFEVSVTQPESCKAACDLILKMSSGLVADRKKAADFLMPSYDELDNVYTLRDTRSQRIWRLDIDNNVLIYIDSDIRNKSLKAIQNREVQGTSLIEQETLLLDGVVTLLESDNNDNGDGKSDDKYNRIIDTYLELKNEGAKEE